MYNLDQKLKREEQLKARLQKTQAGLKKLQEEQRNKKIWKHGIYAEKAEIDSLDDKTFMGALLSIKSKSGDPKQLNEWLKAGEQFLDSNKPKQDKGSPFEITFKDPPSPEVKKALRENGFKFNAIRGVWEGRGHKDLITELVSAHKGILKEI